MAKQRVVNFENGATLIYQKHGLFDGYHFCIGFRGGAQLDGKYAGLSHLLEHLLFRSTSDDLTRNILNNVLKYSINQNAYTTQDCIRVDFAATKSNVDFALNNIVDIITKTHFTQEQVDKEIEVVKQEINMYKAQEKVERTPRAIDYFMSYISTEDKYGAIDILGSPKTLAKITPEILKKYVDRYFNTENMVISVTSNKSLNEVVKICNEKIFSKVPQAQDEKFIIPYPQDSVYENKNMLIAIPNKFNPNVSVALVFRERNTPAMDIDKEYAFDVKEEYLMNGLGGMLFDTLRVKNSLVYAYECSNSDLGSAKLKTFWALTSPNKMNTTIRELCKMLNGIATNGVPKDKFETVKHVLVDKENSKLNKYRNCSCDSNFNDFMYNTPFIDYKRVNGFIENMTYDEFNNHLSGIIKQCNVSLLVDGKFDSRKLYNLIEVEEMIGSNRNSKYKDQLNTPRIEYSTVANNGNSKFKELMDAIIQGMDDAETEDDANNEAEEEVNPVNIDDEELEA